MIPFILLAAGRSERMGRPKGLLDFHGRPWVEAQVEAIRAQGAKPVLVLGRDAEAYAPVLDSLRVQVWRNSDPGRGPISSLLTGLAELAGPVFTSPIDVPVAPVLDLLLGALGEAEAVVPVHGGRGGHPVLLGQPLVERLRGLFPMDLEARLDHQLRRAHTLRVEVPDERVLLNLNTPEAWEAYLRSSEPEAGNGP